MITDYKLLAALTRADLETDVNDHCRQGYIPIGGVAVSPDTETTYAEFFQAVARPEIKQIKKLAVKFVKK